MQNISARLEEVIRSSYGGKKELDGMIQMFGEEVDNIRLETIGSPALGHGSNCKLLQLAHLWLR